MSTKTCYNCLKLNSNLTRLQSSLKDYETIFTKLQNENDQLSSNNTTSGNNRCCIDKEKIIQQKEIIIDDLFLKNGKFAAQYKEKEDRLVAERDEIKKKHLDLEKENKNLKDQNEALLRGNNHAKNKIEDLNNRLAAKNAEIAELNTTISNSETTIEELNETVDVLKEELERTNASLHTSNNEMSRFEESFQSEIDKYKNEYQSKMDYLNQKIFDCNEEINKLNGDLETKKQNEDRIVQAYNNLNQKLKESNKKENDLQRNVNNLNSKNFDLIENEKILQAEMQKLLFELNKVNTALNSSDRKIGDLQHQLNLSKETPGLVFVDLDKAFKGVTVGRNKERNNYMGLRDILLYSYPELFPDAEFLPSSGTGCEPVEKLLSCQQNVVLNIAKLVYASEYNWRIYSTTDKGENPVKDNIVETLKRNCFQLKITHELKCRSQELEQIIDYIYECNVTKLDLSGQFNPKNDNYKKVFSKSVKHAYFNSFGILDERRENKNKKEEIEISEFLKELSEVETIEWISPVYKNNRKVDDVKSLFKFQDFKFNASEDDENYENFEDVPRFSKLQEFKLMCYSVDFNLIGFGEFVKKHRQQNVKFVVQFLNWRDDIKDKFQKQAAEIRKDLPSNCQFLVEFNLTPNFIQKSNATE